MDFTAVGIAVISAVVYALIFFAKARENAPDPKPPFDTYKVLATIAVAIAVGFIAGMTGVPLTEADLLTQLGAYAGYIAMLETLLKALFPNSWPTSLPR